MDQRIKDVIAEVIPKQLFFLVLWKGDVESCNMSSSCLVDRRLEGQPARHTGLCPQNMLLTKYKTRGNI